MGLRLSSSANAQPSRNPLRRLNYLGKRKGRVELNYKHRLRTGQYAYGIVMSSSVFLLQSRRTTRGSTRDARHAGTALATSETPIRAIDTAPIVVGSHAPTP